MPWLEELLIDGRTWRRCPTCLRYSGYNTCRWCGKRYKYPGALRRHEPECYNNPGRVCRRAQRSHCIDCPSEVIPGEYDCYTGHQEPSSTCGENAAWIGRMVLLRDLGLVEGHDGGPYQLTAKGEDWQAKGGGWPEDPDSMFAEVREADKPNG